MKRRVVALLLSSHLGLALFGAWLAGGGKKEAVASVAAPVVAAVFPSPAVDPASANPILRASGADFRAAWDEMLAGPRSDSSGEPHGNSINFFIDWCRVDPDGAVRGLARLHAPRLAHNYLSNATNDLGAALAPALVKHWRELRLMPDYKVEFVMGRSLNALAKEDPQAAAALLGELPPGTRREIYGTLFDRQDAATIERLVKSWPPFEPAADADKARLWTAVAEAVDAADSKRGLWDWLARADDPVARRALAEEGMKKAQRAEDWSGFCSAVVPLEPAARAEMREVVRQVAKNHGYRPEVIAAISEECRRRGLEDWFAGPAGEDTCCYRSAVFDASNGS
jgi:hypothetical protein